MINDEIICLADALLTLKTREEKLTYAVISEQTGASTATISRVNRSLVYGAQGYVKALERMKKEEEA